MGKDLYTAAQFIAAIPGTGGIVTQIAKKVGCSWNTARKYIDEHATVLQAYNDECEAILDMAETALYKQVSEEEAWAVKYLLSTKGKQRGYTERQEIDATVNGSVRLKWDDDAEDA